MSETEEEDIQIIDFTKDKTKKVKVKKETVSKKDEAAN